MSESRVVVYGVNEDGAYVPISVISGATAVNITQISGAALSYSNPLPTASEALTVQGDGAGIITLDTPTPYYVNSDVNMLSAAVRSGNQNTADFGTRNFRGMFAVIDVTALANPLTATIQGKWGTTYFSLLAGAAFAVPGTQILRVGVGLTPAANLVVNDMLPPIVRVSLATTGNHTTAVRFLMVV